MTKSSLGQWILCRFFQGKYCNKDLRNSRIEMKKMEIVSNWLNKFSKMKDWKLLGSNHHTFSKILKWFMDFTYWPRQSGKTSLKSFTTHYWRRHNRIVSDTRRTSKNSKQIMKVDLRGLWSLQIFLWTKLHATYQDRKEILITYQWWAMTRCSNSWTYFHSKVKTCTEIVKATLQISTFLWVKRVCKLPILWLTCSLASNVS